MCVVAPKSRCAAAPHDLIFLSGEWSQRRRRVGSCKIPNCGLLIPHGVRQGSRRRCWTDLTGTLGGRDAVCGARGGPGASPGVGLLLHGGAGAPLGARGEAVGGGDGSGALSGSRWRRWPALGGGHRPTMAMAIFRHRDKGESGGNGGRGARRFVRRVFACLLKLLSALLVMVRYYLDG